MSKPELPPSWQMSERSIKAVQLAFEFTKTIADIIREEANRNGLSTSDQIRQIIGLKVKTPKRPRLTVSLSEEDYRILGQRYNLPPEDKPAIREAIREQLLNYSKSVTRSS